jgi:predicted AAA+ superfamily ATPase
MEQLTKIFILDELKPWKTHIRSSVRIRQSPKWYFVDPCIAVACLHLTYEKLWNDFNAFGFYFESLAIKELRVYADALGGKVYFYKDTTDLEIDAIVETRNGWAAFEIKLGDDKGIEKGIKNLKRFKEKIHDFKNNKPTSFNIITAGQHAYTTEDGINIIPLSHLYID